MAKTLEEKVAKGLEQAKDYLKKLPSVYTESQMAEFDLIVKEDTDNDPIQVTVEVSPYWATNDEINGGIDTVDYEGKDISIDNVPLFKKDLVVRVIQRDMGYTNSEETLSLYKYSDINNSLSLVIY